MAYIDGIVLPVPEGKKQAYIDFAGRMDPVFLEYGALRVVEGWGNDVMRGKTTDFFMATKAEEGENVVFSWIVWPDKAARDSGWEKVMQDPRMQPDANKDAPFDGKRMFWGGFEVALDIGKD
jgi:uncharacterized protein YbaA (DUF1428 family)